ncbi:Predicted arabinose efflux permease, MFS family [Enhydrobacter aerosaccus]|uniref:Predicted arabinose efflux permease, MFS family n=2 Tax=Enhydrobacter aerosaccus TaxID=225324 RepID=A0A1T4JQ84_9HYPH|nr:Predicted arabinose efflux permease, MFS family [Enhydrobacter aerosaccus]
MFALAIVLYSLSRFGSAALAGWISFASMLPGIAISPLAGALLDRMGAPRTILLDLLASFLLLTLLVAFDVASAMSLPLLLVIVVLYSLSSPLSAAGIRTLLPRLVPEIARDRVNALDAGSYALVDVLGPAIAGLLVGFAGAPITLSVIAALYGLAAAVLIPLVRSQRIVVATGIATSLFAEALAGLCYVLRHATLRQLAIAYSLYQMSFGILLIAVPVAVLRFASPGAADSAVGLLWALSGVAGGIGALYAGRIGASGREHAVIIGGTLATAVAIWPTAVLFEPYGLVVGLLLIGFLAGPVDVGVLSLRQRETDPAWLGRSLAVSMGLNMAGLPIGAAAGGLLATCAPALMLPVAACASLLAATTMARRRRF